jgi:hypothetical protein
MLGFAVAFRRSELVGLETADLDFGRDGLTVMLRRSKVDRFGASREGWDTVMTRTREPCPVRVLQSWIEQAAIAGGPVFRSLDRPGQVQPGRLICIDLARIVKKLTMCAGLDAAPYAGHSNRRKLATHTVNRADKAVAVSVPEDSGIPEEAEAAAEPEIRESIRMQALIATIGSSMGLSIWLPRADRAAVLKEWKGDSQDILERLPLNYDDTTLRTIEQIDVLWLRSRSIVRAFEIEHTTSVYSGILRMADLLALQPNMDIKLHIVAPLARRDKVFAEIRRPVFSLLEKGPLAESCTYLSYDNIRELASQKHLAHLSDSVLDEYAEEAE